jgi:hypothetical protein
MADTKISALPASTTPLAGTEVLPIVQSSTTKQVSVANLTAGRAISATQITLTAGNVIPANGYGIDFAATSGTGTSELLADYEEGTFSYTERAKGNITGTVVGSNFNYVKVGKIVYCTGVLDFTITNLATLTYIAFDLPFNSNLSTDTFTGSARYNEAYLGTVVDPSGGSATTCGIYFPANQVLANGAQFSTFSLTYIASA